MPPKGKKKQVAAGSIAEVMTVAALYKRGYPDHKRQYPFTTLRIIKIALLKVLAVSVIIHVAAVAAPPPTPPGYASVLEEAPSPVAKAGKGKKKSGKTGEEQEGASLWQIRATPRPCFEVEATARGAEQATAASLCVLPQEVYRLPM